MKPPEFFIIIDIETAGPSPHNFAMLSLGASTIGPNNQTFYIELKPDLPSFTDEAMKVNGLDLEHLYKEGENAEEAMKAFEGWIKKVTPPGYAPVFTAFNAPFDWMFVNTYFHRYLGYNPFGHKALDIKALFMGLHHVDFAETSHHNICEHYGLKTSLSHHALEDAVQEAQLLKMIVEEMTHRKGEFDG